MMNSNGGGVCSLPHGGGGTGMLVSQTSPPMNSDEPSNIHAPQMSTSIAVIASSPSLHRSMSTALIVRDIFHSITSSDDSVSRQDPPTQTRHKDGTVTRHSLLSLLSTSTNKNINGPQMSTSIAVIASSPPRLTRSAPANISFCETTTESGSNVGLGTVNSCSLLSGCEELLSESLYNNKNDSTYVMVAPMLFIADTTSHQQHNGIGGYNRREFSSSLPPRMLRTPTFNEKEAGVEDSSGWLYYVPHEHPHLPKMMKGSFPTSNDHIVNTFPYQARRPTAFTVLTTGMEDSGGWLVMDGEEEKPVQKNTATPPLTYPNPHRNLT